MDRTASCCSAGRPTGGGFDDAPAARSLFERAAGEVCATGRLPVALLAAALAADPSLEVARAHLSDAAGGDGSDGDADGVPAADAEGEGSPPAPPRRRWDRQHVEIVRAARDGDVDRAEALLRDHVREHGCDPLAVLAVLERASDPGRLADLRGADCRCPWGSGR